VAWAVASGVGIFFNINTTTCRRPAPLHDPAPNPADRERNEQDGEREDAETLLETFFVC
jgi:hypothetical protein